MAIKFKPLGARVLVKPVEPEEKRASGIIIPDAAKNKTNRGHIVAIGDGKRTDAGKLIPMSVKLGDLVHFGRFSATEIKIGGEEFLLAHEADLVAVEG